MRRQILVFIFLAGLSGAGALRAGSMSIPPCVPDTLADYLTDFSGENECSVGILDYGRFTLTESGTTEPAASITLTPQTLNFSGQSAYEGGGFGFSGLSVPSGDTATYVLTWHFYVDPGPVSSGADIGMDPPVGNVTITQEFCLDSEFGSGSGPDFCTGNRNPPLQQFSITVPHPDNHIDFNPPATLFGNVKTTIDLDGTGQPGGSGFDGLSTTVSASPEPGSIALAWGGILAIAAARRRIKSLG